MEEAGAGNVVPSDHCCICSDERSWVENLLVFCDGGPGCDIAVHQGCYGIIKVPKGPWYCRRCETLEKSATVRCELCPLTDGAFKRTDNGEWAHVVCALYIPEVCFASTITMEPILLGAVPRERYNKVCYICVEEGRDGKGACMTCNASRCSKTFHATCAQVAGLLCEMVGNGEQELQYHGYCKNHFKKRELSTDDGKRNTSSAFNRAKDGKKAADRQRRGKDKCPAIAGSSCSSSMKGSENTIMQFENPASLKKAVQTASKKETTKVKSSGGKSKKKDAELHTGQKGQECGGRTRKAGTKSKQVLSPNSEEETVMRKKPKTSKPKNLNQEKPRPTKKRKKPASGQPASSVSSTVATAKGASRQECPAVQRVRSSQNLGTKNLKLQMSSLKVPASKSSKSVHNASLKVFPQVTVEERSSCDGSLHSANLQNSPVLMPALPSIRTENAGLQKCPPVDRDGSLQSMVLNSLCTENTTRGDGCSLVEGRELQARPASENDLTIGPDQHHSQRSCDGSTPMCLELPWKRPSETVHGEVCSMEQLLEMQWSQGHELLLEQANFDQVLGTLRSLHQLQVESQRLEEQIRNLTREKERLLMIKSKLSFPFSMSAANSSLSSLATNALGIRTPCAGSSLPHQKTSPLPVQDTSPRRQRSEHSSAFATLWPPPAANARNNSTSPALTHSCHQLAMSDILKALSGVSLTTDMVLPEPLSPFTSGVVPANGRHTEIPSSPQKIFSPSVPSVMPHPVPSTPSFSQSTAFPNSLPSVLPVALPSKLSAALPHSLSSISLAADGESLSSTSSVLSSLLSTTIPCSLPSDSQANSLSLLSTTDPQLLPSAS